MGQPILDGRPAFINKKKRTCHLVDFVGPEDHKLKIKESEKLDKYLDLNGGKKKLWDMKVTVVGDFGTVTQNWEKVRGIENQRKNRDYSDYNTVKLSWNSLKGPGNLRRLADSQTSI